jgi:hypothetical protein
MIRRFCCRCSERLVETDPDRTAMKTLRGPLKPMRPGVDLCQPCATDFNSWLASYPRPEQANGKARARRSMPVPAEFNRP